MKILKHGNLKPRKFICRNCGCEFVANISEYGSYANSVTAFWWFSDCPECEARTFDSEPWEDQNDTKRN